MRVSNFQNKVHWVRVALENENFISAKRNPSSFFPLVTETQIFLKSFSKEVFKISGIYSKGAKCRVFSIIISIFIRKTIIPIKKCSIAYF